MSYLTTWSTLSISGYMALYMVKDHSVSKRREGMFYLTTWSTHFIYGYMVSDIWYRTTQIARESKRASAARWATLSV